MDERYFDVPRFLTTNSRKKLNYSAKEVIAIFLPLKYMKAQLIDHASKKLIRNYLLTDKYDENWKPEFFF